MSNQLYFSFSHPTKVASIELDLAQPKQNTKYTFAAMFAAHNIKTTTLCREVTNEFTSRSFKKISPHRLNL